MQPASGQSATANGSSRPTTTKSENKDKDRDNEQQQFGCSSNSTIIGHYDLRKTLGKGNFSTVKLAQHRVIKHWVAIKIINVSALSDDNLKKIGREIDIMKRLERNEHIVTLYQIIKTRRYFMLVAEYCENGDLFEYIVQNGRLKETNACDYFKQMLSAVNFLHQQQIVHRDLKAENILLANNFRIIKLADFGFANYFDGQKLLSTWCGSPPYAAPELFKRVKYVGPCVDIWSLGVILYVLVCGSLPFDGHSLGYLQSRVFSGKFRVPFFMSSECESLIRAMLRLDPEKRLTCEQILAHTWMSKCQNKPNLSLTDNEDDQATMNLQHQPQLDALDNTDTAQVDRNKSRVSNRQLVTQSTIATATDIALHRNKKSNNLNKNNDDKCLGDSIRGKSLDLDIDKNNENRDDDCNGADIDVVTTNKQQDFTTKTPSQHKISSDRQDSLMSSLKGLLARFLSDSKRHLQQSSAGDYMNKLRPFITTSNNNTKQPQQSQKQQTKGLRRSTSDYGDVDADMAKAVSNMSLESQPASETSNSSSYVEMIQVDDDDSTKDVADIQLCESNKRSFVKEASLDEQIADYMVGELRVASNTLTIKRSIETAAFDDLHAIYRLLKDKPERMLDELARARSKTPSLPLITAINSTSPTTISKGQPASRRLSITGKVAGGGAVNNHVSQKERIDIVEPLNLKTAAPPRLFLTPPVDAGGPVPAGRRGGSYDASAAAAAAGGGDERQFARARHSFDSAVVHVVQDEPSETQPQLQLKPELQQQHHHLQSQLQLQLQHGQLWDSAMLDSLSGQRVHQSPQIGHDSAGTDWLILQTQLGGMQAAPDAHQMLATATHQHHQLSAENADGNSLAATHSAATAAVVSTSMATATQLAPTFTFAVNQLAAQNQLAFEQHTAPSAVRLLFPVSPDATLERRASDGQASYNSTNRHRVSDSGLLAAPEAVSPLDLSAASSSGAAGVQPTIRPASPRSPKGVCIPFGRPSPSLAALCSGGPGHLLTKRERHSLETDSQQLVHIRYLQHIQHQHQHQILAHQQRRCTLKAHQQPAHLRQYPALSHIGQLRNFAQKVRPSAAANNQRQQQWQQR